MWREGCDVHVECLRQYILIHHSEVIKYRDDNVCRVGVWCDPFKGGLFAFFTIYTDSCVRVSHQLIC